MTFEHFKNFIGGTFFGKYTRLELHYVFNCLDRDGDGFLDKEDLDSAFRELGWTHKYETSEMIRAMDRQNKGKVCFEGTTQIKKSTSLNPDFIESVSYFRLQKQHEQLCLIMTASIKCFAK